MTSEEYIKLYQKYIEGKCNAKEVKQLFDYKDDFKLLESKEEPGDDLLQARIRTQIEQQIASKKLSVFQSWYKYAAVAVLLLTAGTFLFINHEKSQLIAQNKVAVTGEAVMLPRIDSSTAVLTLADGSIIPLEETGNGLLTEEAGTEIRKVAGGELSYVTSKQTIGNANAMNKIAIPRGTTYKITLSDGTKVWLNATSSLSYPANFSGTERKVELVGEAYFEVAKNEKIPFKVKTTNTEVEVLGTHFNISAYANDEEMKTTLLEGAVRLSHWGNKKILKPGHQAITSSSSADIKLKEVNGQQALAWKNGYFLFRENSIVEVMKQISRWYNVQIIYEGNVTKKLFGGIYSKSKKLEELLNGLELTGLVKFKIVEGVSMEERRVVVMD